MACGRPVIAGAVGGLAEMIDDGQTGLLVPAADPEALAAAILRLAGDPRLGSRLAEAARSYVVREHSHVQAAARFVEVYGAVVAGERRASSCQNGGTPGFPVVSVLGSPMHQVGFEQAAATVIGWACGPPARVNHAPGAERSDTGARARVATAFNPELAVRAQGDPRVTEALLGADLRYPDGVGVVWAAGRRGAVGLERVPGVELAARVLEGMAANDLPVYLLGAAPGVADVAVAALTARMPGLKVAGCRHGYFTDAEEHEIVAEIRGSGAAALFVALGTPRQQLFIHRHRDELGVRVAMGVGGSFDVWAGRVRRAPAWTRSLGVEWLYRLVTNPRRARRQIALLVFAWRALTDLSSDYHQPRA
jgi:N-acetylglucosaminyldiphosphoundecaprenol N-acetyl-beta-D-mannosaminyltransferase